MKFLKYQLVIILSVFVVFACTDESLVPEPEPETAVHGYIERNTDTENFLYQGLSEVLSFDWQWVSIDGANTVEKVEFYISFTEVYTDWEGGSKTANHGSELFMTLEGGAVPGNRTTTAFTISQADVYSLFSSAQYAYDVVDGDDPTVDVFNNTLKPNRDGTTQPFVDGDSFQMYWVITTADGRVFDTWNDSICLEFPGANCSFSWAVVCSQDIPIAPGTITITGADSYGDGWNDGGINVYIDGALDQFLTITSGSVAGPWDIVLDGTETDIYFEYVSGDWDSEVTFEITYIEGTTIASWGPSPPAGRVVVNLCSL